MLAGSARDPLVELAAERDVGEPSVVEDAPLGQPPLGDHGQGEEGEVHEGVGIAPSRAAWAARRSSPSTTSPQGRSDISPATGSGSRVVSPSPTAASPPLLATTAPMASVIAAGSAPDRDHLMGVVGDRRGDGAAGKAEAPDEADPGPVPR